MKIVTNLAALAILSISFSVQAQIAEKGSANDLIEGSYIVTFKKSSASATSLIHPPKQTDIGGSHPPFGMHSSGQSKAELGKTLGINGYVASIFETINAAHIMMDAKEADRLRRHPHVLAVEQDRVTSTQSTQNSPGWALDRLDQSLPPLENKYNYNSTGAGQTIYILDSGLNPNLPAVGAEFGNRASIIYDVNGGAGNDCLGHGTEVASAAGGNITGVAKGASLVIAKITTGCTGSSNIATSAMAFNWLATNAPRGTIVNWSQGFSDNTCSAPIISQSLEDSIVAAHNAGIIVVVAAGNDGCNTANYSPVRIPQAFVVGATDNSLFGSKLDAKASYSRTGSNISTFVPGTNVQLLDQNGSLTFVSGTSFSAPYIAGIFAVACQAYAPICSTASTAELYAALMSTATVGSVVNPNGTTLTGATSRFIWKQGW
ncbi:MAG: S8 family serine peptidase [Sulfurimicrobium sp.]|nr:S8 family serine peptidase [Sulfurimicrobium sp.]